MDNKDSFSLFDLVPKSKVVKDKVLPEGVTLKTKYLWCPYCSMPVIFQKDKKLGVKKCPSCNITDRDFWVKKVNKLG
ncbi:hypothetical protein RH915_09135 [Serpentinicella sp. ANB-PHB4]|uniref:hypothetical protein n=1 Tax=Serpentinicella sp. ANB-PHB4 TaxID=3074076 RepID=UPI002856358B|nr:hypothetical protein [Serpentinicella sp. ANB-PHB4]MDR5659658.1 hypothetical protein [Serpentinicella sp. ANB-PHB4]